MTRRPPCRCAARPFPHRRDWQCVALELETESSDLDNIEAEYARADAALRAGEARDINAGTHRRL